jgi:hypothetical protein
VSTFPDPLPDNWVKVTDRLPEHNRMVPVKFDSGGICTSGGPHYDHQLKHWFWFNGYGIGCYSVAAWCDT